MLLAFFLLSASVLLLCDFTLNLQKLLSTTIYLYVFCKFLLKILHKIIRFRKKLYICSVN